MWNQKGGAGNGLKSARMDCINYKKACLVLTEFKHVTIANEYFGAALSGLSSVLAISGLEVWALAEPLVELNNVSLSKKI